MALSQSVAYTTTGTKDSIALDPSIAPFNATVGVTIGTSGSLKLQYSLDLLTTSDANSLWFDSVNIPTGTTSSAVTNLMFPVSKIRLVIDSITGTITLQALQGFTSN